MKQRITYLLPKGTELDAASITVSETSLTYANAKAAAVEKRVTAGLSELPAEIVASLDNIHELHIRWSARTNYHATAPLVARLPPGLHVFFTPRNLDNATTPCPLLKHLFAPDLACHSLATFTKPPLLSARFSHASTYQFHAPLPRLLHFQTFLARALCADFKGPCVNEAAALSYASYLDLDFDVISHAVTATAYWRAGIEGPAARTPARTWGVGGRAEVGVLVEEDADGEGEDEEVKLGGLLTVLGEDDAPEGCALHAYLTLPAALFLDRYQLADAHALAAGNLVALRSLSGAQDLELPAWAGRKEWNESKSKKRKKMAPGQ
ncbi:hypothetical protein LTR08_008085 [Meristemomyces frigidus]|nr:hypothetical protein LTR08_008085 [Meristemomyces frigidus]